MKDATFAALDRWHDALNLVGAAATALVGIGWLMDLLS